AHSGRAIVDGFIAGYEATAALYDGLELRYPVHPHAGLAGVGAVVGLAVGRGLDPLPAARIAGTLPVVPVWAACFDGATARHAFAGSAAAGAVRAQQLADAGFTGSPQAIGDLFDGIVADARWAPPAEGESDSDPYILRASVKLHSACLTCHAAIDAALALGPIATGEIGDIAIATSADVAEKVGRQAAPNDLSARFSLPYAVATALRNGRADAAAFAYEETVGALAAKATISVDDGLPTAGHAMPARVTVTMLDGTRRSSEVVFPRGHHTRPATEDDLQIKFLSLTGGDAALWQRVLDLDKAGPGASRRLLCRDWGGTVGRHDRRR
ncbi:MAG: MmgE/PrpD family protein, partial [Conexibacter sp.]|nr:MmgE/PrpD family protein [Conexibacter sp.]